MRPDVQEVTVERGPRAGHAGLPALPRGDAGDRDDSGSHAASRRPADREAVRHPHRRRQAARNGGARARRDRRRSRRGAALAGARRRRRLAGVRSGFRAAHDGGELPLAAAAAGTRPRPPPIPSGPLEAIALYDRLLAEYPNYEHNDQVLYQKARAYDELGRTEEAMETMERLIARQSALRSTYDEVQFRRGEYFFIAQEVPRRRDRLLRRSSAWAPPPRTTSSRSTSSAGRSTSRSSTTRPCTSSWRCSTTRSRPATTSISGTRRTRNAASPTRFASSAWLQQPRRSGRRARVLRRPTARGPTRTASTPISASTISPSCATTTPRRPTGPSWRSIRSTAVAALQHAGRGDLHGRQVPEAGAGVEAGVRGHVRPAGRVLASLRRRRVAGGAEPT